jgi:hypothetical protein
MALKLAQSCINYQVLWLLNNSKASLSHRYILMFVKQHSMEGFFYHKFNTN